MCRAEGRRRSHPTGGVWAGARAVGRQRRAWWAGRATRVGQRRDKAKVGELLFDHTLMGILDRLTGNDHKRLARTRTGTWCAGGAGQWAPWPRKTQFDKAKAPFAVILKISGSPNDRGGAIRLRAREKGRGSGGDLKARAPINREGYPGGRVRVAVNRGQEEARLLNLEGRPTVPSYSSQLDRNSTR